MTQFPTHLFTLEGITTGKTYRHDVQIRSASAEQAITQAALVGWSDLEIKNSRPLRKDEDLEALLLEVMNDSHFGVKWVRFFGALESWLGFLVDWPNFTSQILSPDNDYARPTNFHSYRFTGTQPGSKTIWVSSTKRAPKDHPGIDAIEARGWLPPTHRFHTGYQYPVQEGVFLSKAVYIALSAITEFTELSPDIFFTFFNFDRFNTDGLSEFHPVTHGDHTYYQLPSPRDVREKRTAALTHSPLTSHVYRKLQPEEREDFIRRWHARYPDCHTWSDDEILHWVTFGA